MDEKESPQAGAIASYLTNYSCYPVYQNTDVTYYDEAIKGLDAQLEDLSKAEKFIFMDVSCHRRRRGMATDPDGT